MSVHLLTDETIGKIAAGEVVERPASVVKELLENALDAGARRIAVMIRDGGSELIEVVDDGCGIPAAELTLAIQRHATSKLTSFEDLDRLQTLGFRGEALPSIGAVSSLTLRSRPAAATHGVELSVEFGRVEPARAAAVPVGTVATVRDLFANVPARRKFLRQASTESTYIARAVAAYAAAYPGVAIALTMDGRRAFTTDGSGDLIAAAVGAYGAEVGQAAISLEPLEEAAAVPGVVVEGWVSEPNLTRSHRQGLVFFVNGRWVQNRPLVFALEEAYHSLLLVGRHPLAVVHVQVDPATVDVNVHPTKAEVKFVDERSVCRAVQRTTHAALARSPRDELPAVRFAPPQFDQTRASDAQRAMEFGAPIVDRTRPPAEPEPASVAGGATHRSGVPILRVLGQISASFIIAEGPEGMYLIDQHAAHERVMYERILAQLQQRGGDRQPLLDPLVVEVAPEELVAFERSVTELAEIGFEIEPFAAGALLVRAIPAVVKGVDIAERLRLILHELAEGGQGDSWLDAVAISTACHTSIRAGQALSLAEMRELVAELERSSQPRACGHGRPTMLQLSRTELERQFARR